MTLEVEYGSALPPITLTGAAVTLRSFTTDDLAIVEEASRDDLIPKITTVPTPFTPAAGRAYLARQGERSRRGEGWSLASGFRREGILAAWERVDGVAKDMVVFARLRSR